MNCLDVRRALGAEPSRRNPELEAHLGGCAACARHAAELERLDGVILRALRVAVPQQARLAHVAPTPRQPRLWALAAGLAATAVLAGVLWSVYPREALATALVGHMAHEADSRVRTDVAAPPAAIAAALAGSGVSIDPTAPRVTYAMSCLFRLRHVPHLVVQTDAGPMTVMVLTREHVSGREDFDEGGYRGVIVPARHGSLAVLAPAGVAPASVDAALARVMAALRYSD
jgi:hypothetical protein